jgi:hypothetical protein
MQVLLHAEKLLYAVMGLKTPVICFCRLESDPHRFEIRVQWH